MYSVIIPVYNKAKYVEKAISSVLAQTYQNFELILINDGSTDSSYEKISTIVTELQNSDLESYNKIRIVNQQNKGVSATRNYGAEIAKFEYLAFLDADDWWEDTFLFEMKKMIEDYPEAGVYGGCYYKIKNGRKIKSEIGIDNFFERGYINYFEVYSNNFYYMPLWVGATVIKKEFFIKENGFKTFLKYGEDFEFWIRAALKTKIAFLNLYLSNYNQDVDFSDRAMNDKLHPVEVDFLFHTSCFEENEKSNEDFKKLLDKFRTYSLYQYWLDKNWHNAAKNELEKVNWEKQPAKVRLKYKIPTAVGREFMNLRKKLYQFKLIYLNNNERK